MKKISWGFIDLARFCVCSLAVLSGGIGCGGGEDDDNSERPSNSNLECEQCVVGVLDESVACLQTADTCVATCVDVNDDDCIEGCKTTAYYCRQDSTLCGLTCPCYLQFAECLVGCGDDQCPAGCDAEYDSCAAEGGPFRCVREFDDVYFDCAEACEQSASDLGDLGSCRAECTVAYEARYRSCLE